MAGKVTFTRADTPISGVVVPMFSADVADVRLEAVSSLPHTTTLTANEGDIAVVYNDAACVAIAFTGTAPTSGQGVPIPASLAVPLHVKPGQKVRLEAM